MNNFNNFGNNVTNSTSEIHIYVHQRGTRKADTIIKGLEFADKDESKKFLSSIKQAFGINGCIKMIEEIDPDNKIFSFTGNYGVKIKDELVKKYNKNEDLITIHGCEE
jgi:translation initiation factor 1 (eIF-1/SUI1)